MQVSRGFPERALFPSVLTIGNFDGVHRGHQSLLRSLTDKARVLDARSVVMTFEPHPAEFFSPARAPARLTPLREKLLLLAESGLDRVQVCAFNRNLAHLSAQEFIDRLVCGMAIRHLVIGDDFRFGAQRAGDFALLAQAGKQYGFSVEAMPTLMLHGQRVSSSVVRQALAEGDLVRAADLLGRSYSIAGRVVHGKRIGHTLGFPTANILLKQRKPALLGVFAVWVEGLGVEPVRGVANVGLRPTVSHSARPVLEVHFFDWQQSCYGAHLRVHFMHKLRAEKKFDSLEALKTQIGQDVVRAREWFSRNPI